MDCPEGSGAPQGRRLLVGPGGGGLQVVDADIGDGGDGVRAAVVAAEVARGGALDLAGAVTGRDGQQGGQDGTADDTGQVGRAIQAVSLRPAVSWSRAASRAVVKLARSGSVPGRVSTAVTMAMRSSW